MSYAVHTEAPPIRLAFFHHLQYGGAQRVLLEYARRLGRRHEITLYTPNPDPTIYDIYGASQDLQKSFDFAPHVQEIVHFPDPRTRFPAVTNGRVRLFLRSLDLPGLEWAYCRMAAAIDGAGHDAVYVQPCRLTQAPLLLRHLRTPSVYYCAEPSRLVFERRLVAAAQGHAAGLRLALRRCFLGPLELADRINARAAGRVLAHSRFTAAQIRACYGLEPVLQYLGVDTERFRPLGRPRSHRVAYVSAVMHNKDQLFAVRALARIPAERRPELVLAFARCDRPYLTEVVGEAARLGVKTTLSEGLDDEGIVALYNDVKVAIYTPVQEPFGLIPLEAMACGTPVAAVAEGGLLESIVSGETGVLSARDPETFAAALSKLLDSQALRESIAAAGLEAVRRAWSWEAASERLEAHLAEMAERRRG